jgi:hypothetical protein
MKQLVTVWNCSLLYSITRVVLFSTVTEIDPLFYELTSYCTKRLAKVYSGSSL